MTADPIDGSAFTLSGNDGNVSLTVDGLRPFYRAPTGSQGDLSFSVTTVGSAAIVALEYREIPRGDGWRYFGCSARVSLQPSSYQTTFRADSSSLLIQAFPWNVYVFHSYLHEMTTTAYSVWRGNASRLATYTSGMSAPVSDSPAQPAFGLTWQTDYMYNGMDAVDSFASFVVRWGFGSVRPVLDLDVPSESTAILLPGCSDSLVGQCERS
jgi:hypothetical protein